MKIRGGGGGFLLTSLFILSVVSLMTGFIINEIICKNMCIEKTDAHGYHV